MRELEFYQQQVLVGLLLGNGSLQNVGKTYRFRFIQSEKRKDYVFHIYDIFIDEYVVDSLKPLLY